MKFSILIPTWNNLPYLQLCIRSIREHSAYEHEIVVHVNEGNDGTVDWLQAEGIRYTHTAENVGVCTAMNMAAEQSKEEIICYINDDMYVLPGWDVELIKTLQSLPIPDPVPKKGEEQEEEKYTGLKHFMLSATMIEPRESGNKCVIVKDFGTPAFEPSKLDPAPVPGTDFAESDLLDTFASLPFKNYWSGSMWPPLIMHRDLWNEVGGFSEEFSPGMYSDPDLAMKLWQAGVRHFIGVGSSRVYHFMSKSTGKVVRNDGRTQFRKKWGISSSTFTKHYLRRGDEMKEIRALKEPGGLSYVMAKLLDKIK